MVVAADFGKVYSYVAVPIMLSELVFDGDLGFERFVTDNCADVRVCWTSSFVVEHR